MRGNGDGLISIHSVFVDNVSGGGAVRGRGGVPLELQSAACARAPRTLHRCTAAHALAAPARARARAAHATAARGPPDGLLQLCLHLDAAAQTRKLCMSRVRMRIFSQCARFDTRVVCLFTFYTAPFHFVIGNFDNFILRMRHKYSIGGCSEVVMISLIRRSTLWTRFVVRTKFKTVSATNARVMWL